MVDQVTVKVLQGFVMSPGRCPSAGDTLSMPKGLAEFFAAMGEVAIVKANAAQLPPAAPVSVKTHDPEIEDRAPAVRSTDPLIAAKKGKDK